MEEKDNIRDNEQIDVAATQPSEDEIDSGVTARYGKFKSPDALYASYTELEAEFTRRSQQLKKLEELCEKNGIDFKAEEKPDDEKTEELKSAVPDDVKREAVREYLEALLKSDTPLMRRGGMGVLAQKQKPKSVKEAGGMALRYFKDFPE